MKLLTLEEKKKNHIFNTLLFHRWNVTEAAKSLGITRKTVYNLIDKYNFKRSA